MVTATTNAELKYSRSSTTAVEWQKFFCKQPFDYNFANSPQANSALPVEDCQNLIEKLLAKQFLPFYCSSPIGWELQSSWLVLLQELLLMMGWPSPHRITPFTSSHSTQCSANSLCMLSTHPSCCLTSDCEWITSPPLPPIPHPPPPPPILLLLFLPPGGQLPSNTTHPTTLLADLLVWPSPHVAVLCWQVAQPILWYMLGTPPQVSVVTCDQ